MSFASTRRVSIAIRALALAVPMACALSATSANASPLIVGNTYSETGIKLCGIGSKKCTVDGFTAVPAGKVLRVNRVSCGFAVPKTGVITSIYASRLLSNLTTATNFNFFASPLKLGTQGEVTRYQINEDVMLPLTATTRPAITITLAQNADDFDIACTVSGTYDNM